MLKNEAIFLNWARAILLDDKVKKYFSVCLPIALMILSIIISTTLKEKKILPKNNRIFVQMTIKQSLMILKMCIIFTAAQTCEAALL